MFTVADFVWEYTQSTRQCPRIEPSEWETPMQTKLAAVRDKRAQKTPIKSTRPCPWYHPCGQVGPRSIQPAAAFIRPTPPAYKSIGRKVQSGIQSG